MGKNKALLPLPPDNQPLIAQIAHRLHPLSPQRIIVVTNNSRLQKQANIAGQVDYLFDAYPGTGALGGIATALAVCEGWAIVVACDMPFVNVDLFAMLCQIASERISQEQVEGEDYRWQGGRWDAVVPVVDGYIQTLHALYHRRCLPAIEANLEAGKHKVASFLADVRLREVSEDEICLIDPDFRSFMNVNTPAEWAAVLQMTRGERLIEIATTKFD